MTNTCPSYEWSRLVQTSPGNNSPCLLEQIIMMVPGPDNQSTCEGEICLNIGRSSPGVSGGQCGARVRVVSNVNHNSQQEEGFI